MILTLDEDAYLMHYGILRKSGRYPWGSGETQSARNRSFLDTVESMKKDGMSEADIAKAFHSKETPFTTTDLRALKSIANNQQKQENISTAEKLKAKGMSNVAIGKQMGIPESSVRNLLDPGAKDRADVLKNTSDALKREVSEKKYVDIGSNVENQLKVSADKLKTAVAALREEGYTVHYVKVRQLGTGLETTRKVLAAPDTPYSEVYANRNNIRLIQEHSDDGGYTYAGPVAPLAVSPNRVAVRYKEDGGDTADGVIYVRPNVDDLSMGGKRYAQVRIQVGDGHYLKGMAVQKDDLPDGVDLQFNTNKSRTDNKLDAMKKLKADKDGNVDEQLPFGAIVRQLPKLDKDGREIPGTVRSALNLVNEEGDWDKWSRTLSTQVLSKQSPNLAREQLELTYERRRNELNDILKLTNPEVRSRLLDAYADGADSSAVRMKAQALPRQRSQVILPVNTLKDNEVYAPNFKNGERVVLVRHPHGGTFEIPELTVNNRHPDAKKLLGNSTDAIGINSRVASRLSGADFDGDTVLVIPNDSGRIKTSRALKGLEGFDPQSAYKGYEGMRTIDGGVYREAKDGKPAHVDYGGRSPKGGPKQTQMGLVSNLITDMTIKGASHDELAAAVRHSMVVIDAEKHSLDYRRSAKENNISSLMQKYQRGPQGGSDTLISRAKSEVLVDKRKPRPVSEGGAIDSKGRRVYTPTNETRVDRNTGEVIRVQEKASRLLESKSAHELSSGTLIENIYADHSDRMRQLGNEARLASSKTVNTRYSPSAKEVYTPQVRSLNAKLQQALENSPRERQAQTVANAIVSTKLQAYPELKDDKGQLKKIKGQALTEARLRTGAKKVRVDITPDEWDAIQAGAISSSKLKQILSNTDLDRVKELATPRQPTVATPQVMSRAKAMLASGYTQADVAAQLGISLTTLKTNL